MLHRTDAQELQLKSPRPDSQYGQQFATGDWGGKRTTLHERGIDLNFEITDDTMWILHGGLSNQEASWPRVRGTIDIDFDKLTGTWGLSFHATGLWQSGVDFGRKFGSLNDPSSLPSAHTARLDSFWLQWIPQGGWLRVRGGQMAGYDFYGTSEYGADYINLALGYAFGNLYQTTYLPYNPAGTPALEFRVQPFAQSDALRGLYVKSALFSGNRNQYLEDPTGFHFKFANSAVSASEVGYLVDAPKTGVSPVPNDRKSYGGVYKFGAILNNGSFSNPLTGVPIHANHLFYATANQTVYRRAPGSPEGLDVSFGWDRSAKDVATQNSQITAAIKYNGPVPRRPNDVLAFGFVQTRVGKAASALNVLENGIPLGREKMFEVNYRAQLTGYFVLQPVFQYYADVGGEPTRSSGTLVGFRVYMRL